MKPRYDKETLDKLNADKEFQRLVSDDEILARLYALPEKTEKDSELEFYSAMGGRFGFQGGFFKPITAGVISLLSLFNSPFVVAGQRVTAEAIDLTMWILCNGKDVLEQGGMEAIKTASKGFCGVLGIEYTDAAKSISEAIRISFLGLSYIMGNEIKNEKTEKRSERNNPFDLEWLARQIAMAYDVAGYTPEQTKWEVSICELSYIACQAARKAGRIVQRPKRADLVMERLHYLMDKRIAEYRAEKNKHKG